MAFSDQSVLFAKGRFSDLIQSYDSQLPKEVEDVPGQQILNVSLTDLAGYFIDRFRLVVPTLKRDQAHTLPPEDIRVPVPHGRAIYFRDPGPHEMKGVAFTLVVPFDGDPDLFDYLPSSFYLREIFGEVKGNTIALRHERADLDRSAVQSDFDERLRMIQEYLDRQRTEADRWNSDLAQRAQTLLEARKQQALEAVNLAESLGYPLKRREAPTYHVPVSRKRLAVQMPTAKPAPYAPEPALAMQQYEEILEIIGSVALMMERSPSAFTGMSEEHLRDHLLVILNSHFEGQATGETFNKAGKTDVLIREKGRNIFIAECKFWDGPKTLTEAIDQLLSYASWRDTKVALIVFNRRKDFSAVLGAIPETVTRHPQCKRRLEHKAEGGFRFLFGQKDDRNRELTLTVLAFDVPRPDAPAEQAASPPAAASAAPAKRPKRKRTRHFS